MKFSIVDAATLIAAGCAIVLTAVVLQGRVSPASGPLVREDRAVPDWDRYAAAGHRLGPENAPLTIVEFGDYECPACRQFHEVLTRLREEHGDQVTIVYRHWPLERHLYAYDAARAAECAAEQNRFWEYHEQLFADPRWLDDAFLDFAGMAGVDDLQRFEDCIQQDTPVESVEADIRAVRELNGFGTPTVLVNGVLLGTVPTFTELEQMLESVADR